VALNFFEDFHFLRPAWLVALPLLLTLAVWLALRRGSVGNWTRLIDPVLLPSLRLEKGKDGMSPWPLLGLVWVVAVLALAGPTWEREKTGGYRTPVAWVLVLDLSPSMAAKDLAPDRIDRARYAVDDLLAAAGDARVALVVFGDDAYTVTPLTRDVSTVRTLLSPLNPDILPTPGDSLAPALDRAGELLRQTAAQRGQVVVLTDGFDDPAAAFAAARQLRKTGTTLRVVAIGTQKGAPLPSGEGSFARDAQGRTRLARVDLDRLRQLAITGGGTLTHLTELPSLIEKLRSASNARRGAQRQQNIQVAHWRDAGIWLLPIVLLCAAFMDRRGWV